MKNYNIRNRYKIFVLLLLVLILFNSNLFAVEFRIDQPHVKLKMPPGWSDGGVINVTNRTKEPVTIRVYAADWVYSDHDGSKNFMPPGTVPNSCADWIKFYPADFTLAGEGEQKVNYVVAISPDAKGGYYAVLFFEAEVGSTWDQTKGVFTKVYSRLGSLFSVLPDGTITREAALRDFKIEKNEGYLTAEVIFENTGNADIKATGTLDIIDGEGYVFGRGELNAIYTMPKNQAKLYTRIPKADLSKGKYDVILTIDLSEGEEILVKEYQLEISETGEVAGVKEIE